MKFLSPEVGLYVYKSTIQPCMEYCCQVWAGAANCYLDMWDELQKWVCRTVGPTHAASVKTLAHRRNVTSFSLSCIWFIFICWLNWIRFHIWVRGLLTILIDCMILLLSYLDVIKMST